MRSTPFNEKITNQNIKTDVHNSYEQEQGRSLLQRIKLKSRDTITRNSMHKISNKDLEEVNSDDIIYPKRKSYGTI